MVVSSELSSLITINVVVEDFEELAVVNEGVKPLSMVLLVLSVVNLVGLIVELAKSSVSSLLLTISVSWSSSTSL